MLRDPALDSASPKGVVVQAYHPRSAAISRPLTDGSSV
jgi:hypothetical protein